MSVEIDKTRGCISVNSGIQIVILTEKNRHKSTNGHFPEVMIGKINKKLISYRLEEAATNEPVLPIRYHVIY